MKLLASIFFLIGGLLASSPVHATEKILVCTNNYEPYYGEAMADYGPVIRITRLAFKMVGYDVDVRFRPWARVLKEAKAGECDVIAGVWFDTGRTDWMALSDVILVNEIGFYKRKDDDLVFRGYAELKAKNVVVGTVRGYISPKGLDGAGVMAEAVPEDLQNMKKLLNHRIRLALVDRQVGRHHLKRIGEENRVAWLATLQKMPLHNAVIKTAKGDWRKRLADFNRGLALLRARGVVTQILNEHHLPL